MEKKGSLLLIVAISLCLNILGINWGIPKDDYLMFYHTGQEMVSITGGISQEYVKKSWEKSRTAGEEKIPRSVFNSIRSFHPDEHNIIKSISNMNPGSFNFNPHFFEYPSFFIYFVAFLLGLASIAGIAKLTPDISFYFAHPGEMGIFCMVGRAGVVLLSVLGVIFLYKAAENFFNRKTAFLAALMTAITPLYVINSHYMTVDVPMIFWITLCLYFLSLFWIGKRLSFFYLAAVAVGMAAGTKYPAAFVWFILPLFYAGLKAKISSIFSRPVVLAFFLTALVFFITTPYAIFSFGEFRRDLFYQVASRGFGAGALPRGFILGLFKNSIAAATSGFFTLSAVFFVSAAASIFTRGKSRFFLAGLIFSLIPILLSSSFKYARYYLIALPFASLLAACFIENLTKLYSRCVLIKATVVILMILPFFKSLAYSVHMALEDVRIEAARYVDENIPYSSRIIFTKDPWIFEVPPVSSANYDTSVVDMGKDLSMVRSGSFLVIGELQHYLGYGSRLSRESWLIGEIEGYGYRLEKKFKRSPGIFSIRYDADRTIHDMIYTHPAIYLFRKT